MDDASFLHADERPPSAPNSDPGGRRPSPPAAQQPDWSDHDALPSVRERLSALSPLVDITETDRLTLDLAGVAAGDASVLQAGDCAEDLRECTPEHVWAKLDVLSDLSGHMRRLFGRNVVQIGRLGGQFAKPRSCATETVDGVDLPAFRGHLVNSEEPAPEARRPDPLRMLTARAASEAVTEEVRRRRDRGRADGDAGPWTSHEALVLDYEIPHLHRDGADGRLLLGSTHLPWLGERTRAPGSAHTELLAAVANPVACKIGPSATPEDVVRLCRILDPERRPGRLVLITRMGRDRIGDALPGIVGAVRDSGHPVVWMCDPMHGNTVRTDHGYKTRHLADLVDEAREFLRVLGRHRLHPGGFHLEVAAADVTECVGGPVGGAADVGKNYTSLCDPRLNPEQAHLFLAACT
ncbi:3-deoxy-7-phosphoheptulonate synthase [Nocardiopsis dassonvillei]|uniref:3-deoxy-7-phosphoheptulonate synthase n=1 Tax=Nocardiopsis dassonvillei TaxID=2014 RepID=UPI0036702F81